MSEQQPAVHGFTLFAVQWVGLGDDSVVTISAEWSSYGDVHACRDGRCVTVSSYDFWPWLGHEAGVRFVNNSTSRSTVVLDFARITPADETFALGLHVAWQDGREPFHKAWSPDELWAALVRLAEER